MLVLKLAAVAGVFLVIAASTPFVVFQASNHVWFPYVLGAIVLTCMWLLLPGKRRSPKS